MGRHPAAQMTIDKWPVVAGRRRLNILCCETPWRWPPAIVRLWVDDDEVVNRLYYEYSVYLNILLNELAINTRAGLKFVTVKKNTIASGIYI